MIRKVRTVNILDHDDDCDKLSYEGGLCTCGLLDGSATLTRDQREVAAERAMEAAEASMENYEGPELDAGALDE